MPGVRRGMSWRALLQGMHTCRLVLLRLTCMAVCVQLKLNEFADLTWEEFSATHLGVMPGQDFTQ